MQVADTQVGIPLRQPFVSQEFGDVPEWHASLAQTACVGVTAIVPAERLNPRGSHGIWKPLSMDSQCLPGCFPFLATRYTIAVTVEREPGLGFSERPRGRESLQGN